MKIEIKHRFSGAVLFEGDHDSLKACVEAAVKARANLAGANLAGADLAGANLAGAYLADAYLAGADLAGANLTGAYLADAYLAGAYLAGANLTGADLAGANLAGARNVPAGAGTAAPAEPYERKPTAERLAERARKFRERNPDVPVVEALDAKILSVIESGNGKLEMNAWHKCKTTHCRAGWAITLAGEAGKRLEDLHGPQYAGTMIYRASTGRVPHFFASDERALEDIREQAAIQAIP